MTGEQPVVEAHLHVEPTIERARLMAIISERLGELGIHHSTLQLDCPPCCAPCDGDEKHEHEHDA